MFKPRMFNLTVCVLAVSLFFLQTSFSFAVGLDDILQKIQSEDALQRKLGQRSLTRYLERINEVQRRKDMKRLLDSLALNSSNDQYQLAVCDGIGQMRVAFWDVEDREQAEKNLYARYLAEQNVILKQALDDALMTARGLYWDAIYDYNNDRVDRPEEVEKKFRRVFASYPASGWASKAHYFLAQYYKRVYFVLKAKNKNPDPADWIAGKSNRVFESFIKKTVDNEYKTDRLQEARYFMALNFVLLKEPGKAKELLQQIIDNSRKWGDSIYVYQFYYSSKKGDVVDERFNAAELAGYTLDYLRGTPGEVEPTTSKEIKTMNLKDKPGVDVQTNFPDGSAHRAGDLDSFIRYLNAFTPVRASQRNK
jgi:hypothetical protein